MKSRLALAISCICVSLSVHAVGISGQGTWETTLQARDLDGNLTTAEAYYDTELNITWLKDANYGYGSIYDGYYTANYGGAIDGRMSWASANEWAASLNINDYTGWRLPTVTDTNNVGCNNSLNFPGCGYNVDTATGEMAHLFYDTLGNWGVGDSSTLNSNWGLTNIGPFSNVQSYGYWTSTRYEPNSYNAWYFNFGTGYQNGYEKIAAYHAWAVHDNDIGTALATSAVPLPASVWLLGSGLLGLIGLSRKRPFNTQHQRRQEEECRNSASERWSGR